MKFERIDPQSHLDELVSLARIEYGDAEMSNKAYLRWQYVENPAGKAIVVVARADNGALAGQYVVIPLDFRLDGQLGKGSLSLNTLTHPDYRGQGLFTKMANETYDVCKSEGLNITLGFPNKNSYPGFVRKLQFQHIGNATVMFRPLRPIAILRHLPKLRSAPKYASPKCLIQSSQIPSDKGGLSVTELCLDSDADAYDAMISTQRHPNFCVSRGAFFARWRYNAIPTRQYRAFKVDGCKEMLATCVVRQRRVKGIECVFIVDLQLGHDTAAEPAAHMLIQSVLSFYRSAGVALAGILVNKGTILYKLSKSLWFRPMPSRLLPHDAPIIVRRNAPTLGDEMFDIRQWDFAFGDYDVF